MLGSIFHTGAFSALSVAAAMATALFLGIAISLLYRSRPGCSGGFCIILAVMPLLVATVILIINGNFGTSVAVLGAFGLMRFRSAPGTAWEIGFLFYAMAVGLAIGMGFLSLSVMIAAVVGAAIFLLDKLRFGTPRRTEQSLKITIPEDLDYYGIFDDLFRQYTKHAALERVKTTNMGTMYELSYRVELRTPAREKEFLDALRCRNGNLTIVLGLVQSEKNVL